MPVRRPVSSIHHGKTCRMPKLYIHEYLRVIAGREVCIACREGILRDHFHHIIADIKFLARHGVPTTFYHNMANRFANRKHFSALSSRLPSTRIVRVPADVDFYRYVLNANAKSFKLVFLERKYLLDHKHRRINALTTDAARETIPGLGDRIANENLKGVMDLICRKIDAGRYDRVHILPARKHTLKHELFTVEGTGTLIANNFTEIFKPITKEEELGIVVEILHRARRSGFVKPRSRAYISARQSDFFITLIDGIIVGCAQKLPLDEKNVELGALAISTRFRGQRVGVFTINAFIAQMRLEGYRRVVSLTNNPRLQSLYRRLGFVRKSLPEFAVRQSRSPGVSMFYKDIG